MTPPRKALLLFALLSACALAPLFVCDPLPLNDYPNHLARMHVIAERDRSPALARHYEVAWQPLPNLAMDVLVPPLARIIGADTASWLFVALTLLLVASGAVALHAALCGSVAFAPLGAFLLLYNRELLWGFLSFVFGVGLALWIFAAWIWLRQRQGRWRTPLFGALTLALYFAHVHAFCCFALLVGGYELSLALPRLRAEPRPAALSLAEALLPLVPPLPLFFLLSSTGGLAGELSYGTVLHKLVRLLAPFNNYSAVLDIGTFLFCAGLLAYGFWRRHLSLHPHMRLPLAALALAFLLLPQQLFDAWSVDRRVLLVLALCLVAALKTPASVTGGRWGRYVLLALLALFLVRTGVVIAHWRRADAIYREHLALLDRVERGSRVAAAVVGADRPHLGDPPLWELPSLVVRRRDAYTNAIFAQEGHHILRVRVKPSARFYRSPSQKFVVEGELAARRVDRNPYVEVPPHAFDYLYLVNEDLVPYRRPDWLEAVETRGRATLYRIRHARAARRDRAVTAGLRAGNPAAAERSSSGAISSSR